MSNIKAKDATGAAVEIKATGDGSTGSPFIPEHSVTGLATLATVAAQTTAQTSLTSIDGKLTTAATAAAQTTAQTSLSSIDSKLTAPQVKASIAIVTAQTVTVGASSAASAAWNASTTRVILTATTDCWVAFGATPTASAGAAGNVFVPAGIYGYPFIITAGQKLAVIQATAAGSINIIEAS